MVLYDCNVALSAQWSAGRQSPEVSEHLIQADDVGEAGLDVKQRPFVGHFGAILDGLADDDRPQAEALGVGCRGEARALVEQPVISSVSIRRAVRWPISGVPAKALACSLYSTYSSARGATRSSMAQARHPTCGSVATNPSLT